MQELQRIETALQAYMAEDSAAPLLNESMSYTKTALPAIHWP